MNKNSGLFVFLICLLILSSCSKPIEKDLRITVTIEPQRYFAELLADKSYEIVSMVPPGVSPESYDPTPRQMTDMARSIAYFQIGYLGFENVWMDRLKKNNPSVSFYNNGEGIDYIHSESHTHDHGHGHHPHDCSGIGIDPHTWSSPRQVLYIVHNMYNALVEIDPENMPIYMANYEKLIREIEETDRIVHDLLSRSTSKAFIIYHPALTYLARDYGLTQYSIELDGKEPSPDQLKKLIDTAKTNNIKTIFIQEEFDKKNAEIIAEETGCQLITINPLAYHWKEEIIRIAKILSEDE